jgi:hypothetical protein
MIFILSALVLTTSCEKMKNKTKETINKGGETVGKTATEFFEGVSEGVDQTLQCELTLSPELNEQGLQTGKFSILYDSSGINRNQLTLYLIFNQEFNSEVLVKAFDKNGLEIGRTKKILEGAAGDAGYFDFQFDKRTDIEVRSKIIME